MQKKILLPADFSDNSWNAIIYALKLYADTECTFYLFHSTNMKFSSMSNLSSKLLETMKENEMKELFELKEKVEAANPNANHKFEIILSPNEIISALKKAIQKYDIDLIITGTKGATAAKRFFFGSNTVNMLKKVKSCPILVIPDNYKFIIPKQIAFPTDFNHLYDGTELRPIRALAELYDSKIRIVHINEEERLNDMQEYNMIKLDTYFNTINHRFHWIPNYTKKTKEINVFIKDLNIDILAIVNYSHGFIENIIKEPVIKKIGFHPIIPFLVIPE